MKKFGNQKIRLIAYLSLILFSVFLGLKLKPTWIFEKTPVEICQDKNIGSYYVTGDEKTPTGRIYTEYDSPINSETVTMINQNGKQPILKTVVVKKHDATGDHYFIYKLLRHFGVWSLLPAIIAIILCWLTREPVSALISGVICGALLLGYNNIPDLVFLPALMSKNAAGVLLLYLFFWED